MNSLRGYGIMHFVGADVNFPESNFAFSGCLSITNQPRGCWWEVGTEGGHIQDIFIALFVISELTDFFSSFLQYWNCVGFLTVDKRLLGE